MSIWKREDQDKGVIYIPQAGLHKSSALFMLRKGLNEADEAVNNVERQLISQLYNLLGKHLVGSFYVCACVCVWVRVQH